jgi:hypothetical protein
MSVRDVADSESVCCTPGFRVIEAIRAELDNLRLHVGCFEQAEAVLSPLFEAAEQPEGAEPATAAEDQAAKVSRRSQVTSEQLCEYVIAHAPITRSQLIGALGGSPDAIDKKLRRLIANGDIGSKGTRSSRVYGPPEIPGVVSLPSVKRGAVSSTRTPPEQGVYPMYDAIVDLGGATTAQLAGRTGLPTSLVVVQCRRLLQLGLIQVTNVGDARVWSPAQAELGRDAA